MQRTSVPDAVDAAAICEEVTVVGMMAIPPMMKYRYKHELIAGNLRGISRARAVACIGAS